jgi:hypothetical protein
MILRRIYLVPIRFTAPEKAEVQRLAAEQGLTVSEYVRRRALRLEEYERIYNGASQKYKSQTPSTPQRTDAQEE